MASDCRVGEGAAHKGRFERARQMDIVDEAAGALDQGGVLDRAPIGCPMNL